MQIIYAQIGYFYIKYLYFLESDIFNAQKCTWFCPIDDTFLYFLKCWLGAFLSKQCVKLCYPWKEKIVSISQTPVDTPFTRRTSAENAHVTWKWSAFCCYISWFSRTITSHSLIELSAALTDSLSPNLCGDTHASFSPANFTCQAAVLAALFLLKNK